MNRSDTEPAGTVWLPDEAAVADLATLVGRARRLDPDGAARLVAHGSVLAVYVCGLHGGGGPTVLGLRTVRLAEPSDVDATVALAALGDRLARKGQHVPNGSGPRMPLDVPAARVMDAGWAGMTPPRAGWEPVGTLSADVLANAARAGIAEVAAGAGTGSGAHAVTRLRAAVWGRPLPGTDDVPTGMALTADALAFLPGPGQPEALLFRSGRWVRLTTSRGHVLARTPILP